MSDHAARGWILDLAIGALGGGIAGAIVAVNVVIYLGPDDGYESSISAVLSHNTLLGIATIAILLAGPLLGVGLMRRVRRLKG